MRNNRENLLRWFSNSEAVLFDMDNTLLDLEDLNYTAFKTAIEKVTNLKYTRKDYIKFTAGYKFPENVILFLKSKNKEFDTEVLLKLRQEIRKVKLRHLTKNLKKHVRFKKGAQDFLEAVSPRYKTALVTSSSLVITMLLLERLNLSKHFDVVITGDSVTNSKPHPEPYITAMQSLKVKTAIVFEDSLAGVLSAKEAGCFVIGVHTPHVNDEAMKHVDYVIEDYTQLLPLLFTPQDN